MTTPRQSEKRLRDRFDPRLVAVAAVVVLTVVAFVVGNVSGVGFLLLVETASGDVTPLVRTLLSLGSLQLLGLVGVGGLYLWRRGAPGIPASIPSLRGVAVVVVGWFLMLGGAAVTGLLVDALGVEAPQSAVTQLATSDPTVLLVLFVASFLIIAPTEELFFRGVVQTRLREVFGPVGAIGIATVVFGLAHTAGFSGSALSIAVTILRLTVVAVVLGVAYEYTENLTVPVAIHAVYNATLFGALYVAVRFAGVDPTAPAALFS